METSDQPSMLREAAYLSCKEVFGCAKKGDDLSLQILDFVGDQLGNACAMISGVLILKSMSSEAEFPKRVIY